LPKIKKAAIMPISQNANSKNADELTKMQKKTVRLVYISALLPAIIISVLYMFNKIPDWVIVVFLISFLLCALGWEIWFTYGLVGGQNVGDRRPEALNRAIPQNINWLLNSLGDSVSICSVGLLLVWFFYDFDTIPFESWRWGAFVILFIWFVGQNIYVELIVYHDQLNDNETSLSWAPLSPAGPWWNPTLFKIGGKSVKFQTQIPWILMTPIFYWLVIICYR
jgi:hypothetical protein